MTAAEAAGPARWRVRPRHPLRLRQPRVSFGSAVDCLARSARPAAIHATIVEQAAAADRGPAAIPEKRGDPRTPVGCGAGPGVVPHINRTAHTLYYRGARPSTAMGAARRYRSKRVASLIWTGRFDTSFSGRFAFRARRRAETLVAARFSPSWRVHNPGSGWRLRRKTRWPSDVPGREG